MRWELEKDIEADIVADAKAGGWFEAKITFINKRGAPDRLFLKPGRFVFLEAKKFGEEPTLQQTIRHNELRAAGAEVYWVDNREDARAILFS